MEHVEGKPDVWTLEYPALGTDPVPVEPVVSPEFFEREREKLFRRVWLNVGRVEEIPNPGDYFVKDIAMGRASVLVIRGKDGRVRAFHNVCTHRGNHLAWSPRGNAKGFVCRFHGWAFDLDGTLRNVPREETFFCLEKSEHGLVPVTLDEWKGFLFIHLGAEPEKSLREFLGPMADMLDGYPFEKITKRYVYKAEVRANWKLILDAFQEIYHFPYQHSRSLADVFIPKEDPRSNINLYKLMGPHRMASVSANMEHVPTVMETFAFGYGGFLSPEVFSGGQMPEGVNPTGSPSWATDINVFFPNFLVQIGANGAYSTWNLWPLDVDRTIWEARMYMPEPQNLSQRFCQEYFLCSSRDTILEDMSTLERVQAGLSSGALKSLILNDDEILVRHFHKTVEEMVAA